MAFEKPTPLQLDMRYCHIKPSPEQGERMGHMRAKISETAKFCVERTPCCPEQTRALNALDDAMFLFNAAIARHEKEGNAQPHPDIRPDFQPLLGVLLAKVKPGTREAEAHCSKMIANGRVKVKCDDFEAVITNPKFPVFKDWTIEVRD